MVRTRSTLAGILAVTLAAFSSVSLWTEPVFARRTNNNETPRQSNAILFQPCAFELGSVSGPLKTLADSQHYSYVEYTNTADPRPDGTSAATLDTFATLGTGGIVMIAAHGVTDRLLAECYPKTDAGRAARDARLRRLCDGTDQPGGVRLTCPTDVWKFSGAQEVVGQAGEVRSEPTDFGIGLSKTGIRKLFSPGAHTIVFMGACNSFALRDAFPATVEYFGYTQECLKQGIDKDAAKLFERLAGTAFDGKAREVGSDGAILPNIPDGSCTAFGRGGFTKILRHAGPGNTTVAPIVAWVGVSNACGGGDQAFMPRDKTFSQFGDTAPVKGRATFDTAMDTTVDPASVLTPGDDNGCRIELKNVMWSGNSEITFDIVLRQPGTFDLKVHQELAKSLHNTRELDGNQNPRPFAANGVGPNRDDYVAKNRCGS